jgi:SAM-dependent methyltransferase
MGDHNNNTMPNNNTMEGWTTHESKTHARTYYVHAASGRRQWHAPNARTEQDRLEVARFYAQLNPSDGDRAEWRKFNNFMKQAIMYEFSRSLERPLKVLDVGCGSGGDFGKWSRLGAGVYLGFDACSESVSQLASRAAPPPSITRDAFAGDFTLPATWERVPRRVWNVVSCQFACHYAFGVEDDARAFMHGIAGALNPASGLALLVTVDSVHWRGSPRRTWGPARMTDCAERCSAFGDRYVFKLGDRVAAPEWWVHKESVVKVAGDAGLELLVDANLATLAAWLGVATQRTPRRQQQYLQVHAPALQAMCGTESPSAESWLLASVYRVFVLCHKGSSDIPAEVEELRTWMREHH